MGSSGKESEQMRTVMNLVVQEHEKKMERKRDLKFKNKKLNRDSQRNQDSKDNGVSLVDSIFQPSINAFKG